MAKNISKKRLKELIVFFDAMVRDLMMEYGPKAYMDWYIAQEGGRKYSMFLWEYAPTADEIVEYYFEGMPRDEQRRLEDQFKEILFENFISDVEKITSKV